jgi:hypothetical protein
MQRSQKTSIPVGLIFCPVKYIIPKNNAKLSILIELGANQNQKRHSPNQPLKADSNCGVHK